MASKEHQDALDNICKYHCPEYKTCNVELGCANKATLQEVINGYEEQEYLHKEALFGWEQEKHNNQYLSEQLELYKKENTVLKERIEWYREHLHKHNPEISESENVDNLLRNLP